MLRKLLILTIAILAGLVSACVPLPGTDPRQPASVSDLVATVTKPATPQIEGMPLTPTATAALVQETPAPPAAADTPAADQNTIRFAIIGDYGLAISPGEGQVAGLVKSWQPAFIITVGDNNYTQGSAETIDQNVGLYYHDYLYPYNGSYGAGSDRNRFFPTLGNHDWNTAGAAPYLAYFALPGNERYYDFVQGPVHFFALDSDEREPDGTSSTAVQAKWLRQGLAGSTACWNLVYFHHPPYSSGPHEAAVWMRWPFKEWGADVVFAGHDHIYERILRDGMPYFIDGLGGVTRYDLGTPVAGSKVRYQAQFGAMLVTATRTTISYEFQAVDGTVVDRFSQQGGCTAEP